jgi:hypothetical protein
MGKMFIAFMLGTAITILSYFVFGGGLLTSFFSVSAEATSPQHMLDLATGNADPAAEMGNVILFIANIAIYYLASAILVFLFDLCMPSKKEEKK